MIIILYAGIKLLAYSLWCGLGLRLAGGAPVRPWMSARLGGIRWLIGLAFGVALFLLIGSIAAADAARLYFLVYTPVRAVEWGIMAILIRRQIHHDSRSSGAAALVLWCIGGMVLSFLTDLVSPEGLQGRFCVGRCLC
jgi:hypothetical protein